MLTLRWNLEVENGKVWDVDWLLLKFDWRKWCSILFSTIR